MKILSLKKVTYFLVLVLFFSSLESMKPFFKKCFGKNKSLVTEKFFQKKYYSLRHIWESQKGFKQSVDYDKKRVQEPCFYKGENSENFDSSVVFHGDFRDEKLLDSVQKGDLNAMKYLLKKGANPNIQDNDGMTPLHYAVLDSKTEMVQILMQKNANPNIQNNEGATPFHYACKLYTAENSEILRIFLLNGADPNIRIKKR